MTEHSLCPGPERLAAYVDGKLEPHVRREVSKHLASCGACRAVIADVAKLSPVAEPPKKKSSTLWVAVAAALLLAIVGGWWWQLRQPELVIATRLDGYRPVEARISGIASHAPWRGALRGDTSLPTTLDESVRLRLAQLRSKKESPDVLAELGQALLVLGKTEEAIQRLEAAFEASPSADIASDLAAAYLSSPGASAPVRALDWSTRALDIDARHLEATFNRALARGRLFAAGAPGANNTHVIDGWRDYLKLDPTSKWADEAREAIRTLEAIPEPAAYVVPPIQPKDEPLKQAFDKTRNFIGTGDLQSAITQALQALEQAPPECCSSGKGLLEWIVGYSESQRGRFSTALTAYLRSEEHFTEIRDWRRVAQVRTRVAELYDLSNQHERAWEVRLDAFTDSRRLAPDEFHMLLIMSAYAAQWSELNGAAGDFLEASLKFATNPGEKAESLSLMARNQDALGNESAALNLAERALEQSALVEDPGLRERYFAEATLAAALVDQRGSEESVRRLDEAIQYFDQQQAPARLAELFAERWHRTSDDEDYRRALDRVRASRDDYTAEVDRSRFFTRATRFVSEELDAEDKNSERLFQLSEGLRAELQRSSEVATLDGYAKVHQALRGNETLLYFHDTGSYLHLWQVGKAPDVTHQRLDRGQLLEQIEQFEAAMRDDRTEDVRQALDAIHRGLGSVDAEQSDRIWIAAHGIATRIPFPSLIDHRGSRWIEQTQVIMVPSAS